jgi:hypothetical protein
MGRGIGFLLAIMCFMLMSISSIQAASVIYTDLGTWQTAVAGSTVWLEDFTDSTLNTGLTFTSGTGGSVSGGVWNDVIDEPATTQIDFSSAMWAAGGLWNLFEPGGPGSQILVVTENGLQGIGEIPNTLAGSFWGFTSTIPFTSIVLLESNYPGGIKETYTLDDFRYAEKSAVPVPAAFLLLGSGLLGLVGIRRRQK